jgi:hypothetical protein
VLENLFIDPICENIKGIKLIFFLNFSGARRKELLKIKYTTNI